jgi:hypothetical protein
MKVKKPQSFSIHWLPAGTYHENLATWKKIIFKNLQISVIFSVMKNPLSRSKCVGWLLKKFDDL